jgi:hypothetical protein
MWGRISLLLNMHKKECIQNILNEMLLAPACNGARCNKYIMYLSQRAQRKKHRVEHKLSNIFKAIRLSWV